MEQCRGNTFHIIQPFANKANPATPDESADRPFHCSDVVVPYRAQRQNTPLVINDSDQNIGVKLLQKIRNLIGNLAGR